MKFGYPEMREFAEQHSDPRVRALWQRLGNLRSKTARWCEAVARAEQEAASLRADNERLSELAAYYRVYMEALDRSDFDMSLCRRCALPIVCLPDGLAMCFACLKSEEGE